VGVSFALFLCALTWSSDSLAACGQHLGSPRRHAMTEVAHFKYALLIFGPDTARDLIPPPMSGAFSCPGRGSPESPPLTHSVPLRVEPWGSPTSAASVVPSGRPLWVVEHRDRPRVYPTPLDRPPKGLATV